MKLSGSLFPVIRISLALLGVVVFVAIVFVRHSYPRIHGVSRVSGLESKVDVYRDHNGIPHIFADNDGDTYFAQGYVHAQDRLRQMEFQRRSHCFTAK